MVMEACIVVVLIKNTEQEVRAGCITTGFINTVKENSRKDSELQSIKKILSTDEIQDLRGSESADVLYLDKYKYLKYAIEKLAVQQLSFLIRIRIRITGSKG